MGASDMRTAWARGRHVGRGSRAAPIAMLATLALIGCATGTGPTATTQPITASGVAATDTPVPLLPSEPTTPSPSSVPPTSAPTATPTPPPTPEPTPPPTPPPTPAPTAAAITFELDLVGAVDPADRYSAVLSIDGTEYVNGFCGFDAAHRCSADRLYSWSFPRVAIGATLDWHYRLEGGADIEFAQGVNVTLTRGLLVVARCIYDPDVSSEPTCSRTQ